MQQGVQHITKKDGSVTTDAPAVIPGASGRIATPVPCAPKVGSHSFAFSAQFLKIQDASIFEPMRVKCQPLSHGSLSA